MSKIEVSRLQKNQSKVKKTSRQTVLLSDKCKKKIIRIKITT